MRKSSLEKYAAKAKELGLEFIGPDEERGGAYLRVRLGCGHEASIFSSSLMAGKVPTCHEEGCPANVMTTYTAKAHELGLELLGRDLERGSGYLRVRLGCGHEASIFSGHLMGGSVPYCTEGCVHDSVRDSYTAKAHELGLELLGRDIERGGRYLKVRLGCGHEASIFSGRLMEGSVPTCQECGYGHYTEIGEIYIKVLWHVATGYFVKLGLSKAGASDRRTSGMKLVSECECVILGVFSKNANKVETLRDEKQLHKALKSHRMDPLVAKSVMKSGFTECYNTSVIDHVEPMLARMGYLKK